MANAWDLLTETSEKLEHLEKRVRLAETVDEVLEQSNLDHLTMGPAFERVFAVLREQLGAGAAFIRTVNEDLALQTIAYGVAAETVDAMDPGCRDAAEPASLERDGLAWHFLPLDVAGDCIGTFGMAVEPGGRPAELVFDLMEAVSEELDQFFFAIQENRRKQLAIEAMQEALKSPILVEAVDDAVAVLQSSIPIGDLVLLYLDEDTEGRPQIQYIVYLESAKRGDSVDDPLPALDELIRRHGQSLLEPGNSHLASFLPGGACAETRLIDGLVKRTLVGKMALRPANPGGFSLANREIIQIFTESLRQRLVDFNREKKVLRRHFAPDVARRLIRSPDYEERNLAPQARDVGILYADISGFTKMCEQILRDPGRIGAFVDGWAHGVVECLYAWGGSYDKMVGDCVIGLFGPPFFAESARLQAARTLAAAVDIRKFTKRYFESPENDDVSGHPLYPDLGVAIGVNFCPGFVGLFGPDQAYTCFSSGMNNAARLQGLARAGQILVMENAKILAEGIHGGLLHTAARLRGLAPHADAARIRDGIEWLWSGPFEGAVKNVREPLRYYLLG